MTVHKVWVELENPKLQVPAYAIPDATVVNDRTISIVFNPGSPEADAIIKGYRYAYADEFVGFFESSSVSNGAKLKPMGRYSIDEKDLEEADFLAYYTINDNKEAVTVAIVDEVKGPKQIKLFAGGRVEASPDLNGKALKLRVTYPTFVRATEKYESLTVHLIELDGEGAIWKAYYGCVRDSAESGRYSLRLKYQPDRLEVKPLTLTV